MSQLSATRDGLNFAPRFRSAALALLMGAALFLSPNHIGAAHAQELLQPGETYVTRFSGTAQEGGQTVIDVNGTVGSIIDVRRPGEPPNGQQWRDAPQRHPVTAAEVGQVFGVALDNATPPNIYLTATSAFGLHRNGDNSNWMDGQWGQDGGPATVWKLNAENNYTPEHFADLTLDGRGNTGAALGNIAYDKWHDLLFVSDMETGMIHRLRRSDGSDLGHFDHGVTGRGSFYDAQTGATLSLGTVAFNPASEALTATCPFGVFAQTPNCWNFADFRRRVWGVGVRRDTQSGAVRLYYAVWGSQSFGHPEWAAAADDQKNSVWSVGLDNNGDFVAGDVRREFILPDFFTEPLDILRAGYSHPVADIAFPQCSEQNVMILAERGGVRNLGLDAEDAFATPHESRVLRYELDANGVWQPIGRYDVGHYRRTTAPTVRVNASGGAAFGFHYNQDWTIDPAQPDQFLWMTGDNLCSPDGPCTNPATGAATDTDQVSGEQGTPVEFHTAIDADVAETQDAPASSYMIDTDVANDPARNDATRIGDVEIYEPCGAGRRAEGGPGTGPWPIPPGEVVPPEGGCPRDLLRIEKTLGECHPEGGPCTFHITLTNVSDEDYVGPLFVNDFIPPGTAPLMPLSSPGWNCQPLGGELITCMSDTTMIPGIPAGDSVSFDIFVGLPPGLPPGTLNCAEIVWPMDAPPLPGGDLAEGGTWEVAWVQIALAQHGLLPMGVMDGTYDAGNPLDPTQHAIDQLLGTPPGTGTLAEAQAVLFPNSAGLHADCDPDNDSDCVPIVPEEPGQPGTDLQLNKFLFQDGCTPDGNGGYYCLFGIDINNAGPNPYTGPLHLHEQLPAGATFQGINGHSAGLAGIACGPIGGNVVDCYLGDPPGVTIPPWQWLDILIYAPGPLNGDQNCVYLGSPTHDSDPGFGNDACAALPSGPVAWGPAVMALPDLAVEKTGPAQCTAGGTCTYQVTITNNGPGVYTGPLDVTDLPTGVPGVTFVSASPGWTCNVSGALVSCHHDPLTMGIGASQTLSITLQLPAWVNPDTDELTNCTWLMDVNPLVQQGGSLGGLRKYAMTEDDIRRGEAVQRLEELFGKVHLAQAQRRSTTDAATASRRKPRSMFHRDRNQQNNTSCTRTRIVNPTRQVVPTPMPTPLDCWGGWREVPRGWQRRGWEVKELRRGRDSIACARRVAEQEPVEPLPIAPECRRDYKLFGGLRQVPRGWQSYALRVRGRVVGWCARPGDDDRVPPPRCDEGWRQFPSVQRIPKGWDWTKKRRGDATIFCARPRRIEPSACGPCRRRDPRSNACVCTRKCYGGAVLNPRTCTCGPCPAGRPTRTEPAPCTTACKPPAEPVGCPDGQVRVRGRCVCPGNTTWDRRANKCVTRDSGTVTPTPTPTPSACPDGQVRRGRTCVCPGKTIWDRKAGKCVTRGSGTVTPTPTPTPLPRCTGGQVLQGRTCVCPAGTVWNVRAKRCRRAPSQRPTKPKVTPVLPKVTPKLERPKPKVVRPPVQTPGIKAQPKVVRPPAKLKPLRIQCTGGRIRRGNACVCPRNRPQWTGSACVPAVR